MLLEQSCYQCYNLSFFLSPMRVFLFITLRHIMTRCKSHSGYTDSKNEKKNQLQEVTIKTPLGPQFHLAQKEEASQYIVCYNLSSFQNPGRSQELVKKESHYPFINMLLKEKAISIYLKIFRLFPLSTSLNIYQYIG